jgi:hypothetical protein
MAEDITQENSGNEKHLVLYVEDNPVNLRLISQVMERLKNVELITAHSPQLGLEIAAVRDMKLILLDINLPGMSGFELLNKLRSMDKYKQVPILAVSANAMPGDIEKGIQAGFDEYITKPINIQNFLKTVESHLKASST